MGKTNIVTVLAVSVVQFIIGYLWYGPHFFGDVMTATGGHSIDFMKLDVVSLLLILFSSYGLVYILDLLTKYTGTKDIGGALKLGLTVGTFAIGLPIVMMLNFLGFGKIVLLVVLIHLVLITTLSNIVVIKMKHV